MRIMVVNDDGIESDGIRRLAGMAAELGEVWVLAPRHQCSAMSQRITIRGDMRVDKVRDFPVPVKAAYKVDGTPADCLKIAMQYLLEEKPDYVFSGINDGYNAGFDIAYSGTLGAAFEAVMNGVPAIVIFEGGQSELLANVVAQIYAHLLQHPSRDPVGLAVYVELRYMTASLMLGEWFE